MLKTLPLKNLKKINVSPKSETIFSILNYSKSVTGAKILHQKKLIQLN